MSVSAFRELLQKPGCGIFVGVIFALIMLAFILPSFGVSCGSSGMSSLNPEAVAEDSVAKVDDHHVSLSGIQNFVSQMTSQGAGPRQMADAYVHSVDQWVTLAYLAELAERKNLDVSSEEIEEITVNGQLEAFRMQMVMQGQLEFNATDQQFKEALQKQGASYDELVNRIRQQVQQMSAKPSSLGELMQLRVGALGTKLLKHYEEQLRVDDQRLKSSYDVFKMKQIAIQKAKHPNDDVKAIAEKVLTEVKGGLDFAQAMNKYAEQPAEPGKPVSQTSFEMPRSVMETNPDYAPLLKLKAGDVSDVIVTGNDASIFKVTAIESQLPPEYEKQKAELRKTYVQQLAIRQRDEDLEKLREEVKLEWLSPAFEGLYAHSRFLQDRVDATPAERKAFYQDLLGKAKKAVESETLQPTAAAMLLFIAVDELYKTATPQEKTALLDDRIQSMEAALSEIDDTSARLELVDLYAKKKDGEKAFDQLSKASAANVSDTSAVGESNFREIGRRLSELKRQNLLNADQVAQIQADLDEWRENKKQADEYERQQRAEEEKARKEAEEAEKQRKAEEEKAKASTGTTGTTGMTGTTGTGTTGTGTTGLLGGATTGN